MSDSDKKYKASLRLVLPRRLFAVDKFAFRSPLSFDECLFRLRATNGVHASGRLRRDVRIRADIYFPESNVQPYLLKLISGPTAQPCWTRGIIHDMDGEATWVEGKIGMAQADTWPLLIVGYFSILIIAAFVPHVWFMLATLLWPVAYALLMRAAKSHVRRHLRDAFGLTGTGTLPIEQRPSTIKWTYLT